MKVFVDTNIFRSANYNLNSSTIGSLQSAQDAGFELHVPRVVLLECQNQIRELARQNLNRLNKAIRSLHSTARELDLSEVDAKVGEAAAEKAAKQFEADLRKGGWQIANLPKVGHTALIARDLDRRPPFQQSGKGYRDTLIWETILENASPKSKSVFISENSNDFGSSKFHAELVKDLEARNLDVDLVNSSPQFLDDFVEPRFAPVAALIGEGLLDVADEFIDAKVEDALWDAVADAADFLDGFEATDEHGNQIQFIVSHLEDWDLGEIKTAAELPDGKILLGYEIGAHYEIQSDAPPDYQQDGYISATLKARILVDFQQLKVSSAEVVDMEIDDLDWW